MEEIGSLALSIVGLFVIVVTARVAWTYGEGVALWLARKSFNPDEMEWRRGTANGRPPLRYIVDGWGRVVYAELDPDAKAPKEGRNDAP